MSDELEMLRKEVAELRATVQHLKDVQDINDVFFKWHFECTGGFKGKQAGRAAALECLTEDAEIDVPPNPPGKGPKGREEYTEFWDYFYGDDGPLPYVFQTSTADKVEVNGDMATQHSNMLGIFQSRGDKPRIGLSQRINTFRRTPEGWRICKTTIEGGLSSTLTAGLNPHGLNELPPQEERVPFHIRKYGENPA
ncbi:MAG: nuclear transport factor 2 family protein [Novosphingobium sp.]|nr:nuclear transport factor 2 family protein [Novosphingobium sp.]